MIKMEVDTGRFTPEELKKVAARISDALAIAMKTSIALIVGHAVRTKLLRANPPFLNKRTGNLIDSVTASMNTEQIKYGAIGRFGTNVGYGVRHEVGFRGKLPVPAHVVGGAKVAEHVRFTKEGAPYTVKSHHRSAHEVREHTRKVNIPARWMLNTALEEMQDVTMRRADRALEILVRTGVLPTPGETRQVK